MTPVQGCGTCTMCCKLLKVDELDKPQGQWCTHCAVGQGCKIYSSRPPSCETFDCIWMQTQYRPNKSEAWGLGLRPDNCHFMLVPAAKDPGIVIHVDPARPDAWKSTLCQALIKKAVSDDLKVFIVCGDKRKIARKSEVLL